MNKNIQPAQLCVAMFGCLRSAVNTVGVTAIDGYASIEIHEYIPVFGGFA